MTKHLKPRQYGDTMECSHCGKQWDTNDPFEPDCITVTEQVINTRNELRSSREPIELSRYEVERIERLLRDLYNGNVVLSDMEVARRLADKLREKLN